MNTKKLTHKQRVAILKAHPDIIEGVGDSGVYLRYDNATVRAEITKFLGFKPNFVYVGGKFTSVGEK